MISGAAFPPVQPTNGFIAGSKKDEKDKKEKYCGLLYSLIRRPIPGTISELSPYFKKSLSKRLTGKPSVTIGVNPETYNGVGNYYMGPEINL